MSNATRFVLLFLFLLALRPATHAQMGINSPVGVTPQQDLEVYTRNSFLVQQKYRITTADPKASITNLSCISNPATLTAPAGILKDPWGDGNYSGDVNCSQMIFVNPNPANAIGYEITFTDLNLTGTDRVIISDPSGNTLVFSGSTIPETFVVSRVGGAMQVRFITEITSIGGRGFVLQWRAVYADESGNLSPSRSGFGKALHFDANKGALLGGFLGLDAAKQAGAFSFGFGTNNVAKGNGSIALGNNNKPNGDYSMAVGANNVTNGNFSMALGANNKANGVNSIALGDLNTVSGDHSMAMGYRNVASGDYSTALGTWMNTDGQRGAFMIGDYGFSSDEVLVGLPNQFVARFRNGYYLMTSGNVTRTGVYISAGQNAWSSISDSTRKERFVPMNHAEVLRKINAMKLTSWNYKGQREIRHYGPMAQDFYAAFGYDGLGPIGCDTLINSHDFAGVTFAGVQALIRENAALKTELAQTKADFENRLALLEQAMLGRKRVAMRKR